MSKVAAVWAVAAGRSRGRGRESDPEFEDEAGQLIIYGHVSAVAAVA